MKMLPYEYTPLLCQIFVTGRYGALSIDEAETGAADDLDYENVLGTWQGVSK